MWSEKGSVDGDFTMKSGTYRSLESNKNLNKLKLQPAQQRRCDEMQSQYTAHKMLMFIKAAGL